MLASLLALTLAASAAPADPFADDGDTTRILGVGISTCAANMTKENDDGPVAWVFGFWTGLNAAFGEDVGKELSPREIYREVIVVCMQDPSLTLSNAAWTAYQRVRRGE